MPDPELLLLDEPAAGSRTLAARGTCGCGLTTLARDPQGADYGAVTRSTRERCPDGFTPACSAAASSVLAAGPIRNFFQPLRNLSPCFASIWKIDNRHQVTSLCPPIMRPVSPNSLTSLWSRT